MSKCAKYWFVSVAVMCVCVGAIGAAHAAGPQYLVQKENKSAAIDASSPLVVVSHVDVMPKFTDPAYELLRKYRHEDCYC